MNLCHIACTGALNLYAIPYLVDIGINRTTASTVVSLYTLVSLFARMPMGMLSDVFRKSHMIAFSIALQGVGFFLFWLIGGTSAFWLILLFGIIYGLGLGGAGPLRAPVLAEYFGTKNFGTIFGLSSIFMTVASVASPLLAGWIYDTYHDFKYYWLGLAVFNVLVLIMILTIPAAGKRTGAMVANPSR